MSFFRLFLCTVLVLTLSVAPVWAERASFDLGTPPIATVGTPPVPSFADLAARLLPSVVNISSMQKSVKPEDMPDMPEFPPGSPFEEFFQDFMNRRGPGGQPQASLGSGFIIDAEKGIVVTNNHVVDGADEVRVTLHDDTTLDAKILGTDEKTDLAVLQVDAKKAKLVAVPFGDSDAMRVGDWVMAIGNPFGLGGSVTAGIISARARDIHSGPYDDFLQTDASINRGNSGGPMFNLRGEVIGINTAIFSPTGGSVGIGFAIPANLAKPVVTQIVQYGRTKRGWIGVRIQSVTDDIAESLGLGKSRGALIASVAAKGPADVAGIKPGDIVVTYNGHEVNAMRQLPRLVAETAIGSKVTLGLWRDGRAQDVTVTIAELEQAEKDGAITGPGEETGKPGVPTKGVDVPQVGLNLGVITAQDRDDMELPDGTNGVIVLGVKKDSEAASKGLEVGDIILEVNQQAVSDPKAVARMVTAAGKDGKSSVLLLVDTQGKGDVRFVALKLKK